MISLKAAIRNPSLALVTAQGYAKFLRMVQTFIMAKFLPVEEYGILAFFFAFTTIQFFASDLGITLFSTHEIITKKANISKILGFSIETKIASTLVILLLLVLTSSILPLSMKISLPWLLLGTGMCIGEHICYSLFSILRSQEKFHLEAFITILKVTLDFLAIAAVIYFKLDIINTAAIIIFNLLTIILIVWPQTTKFYGTPHFFKNNSHFKLILKSLPYMLLTVFTLILHRIDTLMIKGFFSFKEVGIYEASCAFTRNLSILAIANILPFFTDFSKNSSSQNFKRAIKFTILLSVIFLILQLIFGENLILLIYGIKYSSAIFPMKILSIATVPIFFNITSSYYLGAANANKANVIIMFSAIMVNTLMNFIAIPKYGIAGGAFTTLTSEIFMVLAYTIVILKMKKQGTIHS